MLFLAFLASAYGQACGGALQDAVEGIQGLMRRFEELQPRIASLPPMELQQVAQPAQKLHERFEEMKRKLKEETPEMEEERLYLRDIFA